MKKIGSLAFAFLHLGLMSIVAQVNLTNGLVLYIPFNGNISDSTGNFSNLNVGGGVSFVADRTGKPGAAGYFDGTVSSYLTIQDSSLLRVSNLTISAVIKPAATTRQYGALVCKRAFNSSNNEMYNFTLQNGTGFTGDVKRNSSCITGTGWQEVYSGLNYIATNEWVHVVFTYDGTLLKLFKNGTLVASATSSSPGAIDQCQGSELLIGTAWSAVWNSASYIGAIDEVRLYNRALNSQEISLLNSISNSTGAEPDILSLNGIYPNPASGSFTLNVSNGTESEEIKIDLCNELGQVVQTTYQRVQNGSIHFILDRELKSGTYFIKLNSSNAVVWDKILVIR